MNRHCYMSYTPQRADYFSPTSPFEQNIRLSPRSFAPTTPLGMSVDYNHFQYPSIVNKSMGYQSVSPVGYDNLQPNRATKSRSAGDNRSYVRLDDVRRTVSETHLSISKNVYSRKVFIGGLPTDVDREHTEMMFAQFGNVTVDWPREPSYIKQNKLPPTLNGYVFLVYDSEVSVHWLVKECIDVRGQLWLNIPCPKTFKKAVQVRPWKLSNMTYFRSKDCRVDPRFTVFIGGVPRPCTAVDLVRVMEKYFGKVLYADIDTDPELHYPKGAARVTFSTMDAYRKALDVRYVKLDKIKSSKREVEIKPYIMDDQPCDECNNALNRAEFAPYFCCDRSCLQYYCSICWDKMHYSEFGERRFHRPSVRMGEQTKELSVPHGSYTDCDVPPSRRSLYAGNHGQEYGRGSFNSSISEEISVN